MLSKLLFPAVRSRVLHPHLFRSFSSGNTRLLIARNENFQVVKLSSSANPPKYSKKFLLKETIITVVMIAAGLAIGYTLAGGNLASAQDKLKLLETGEGADFELITDNHTFRLHSWIIAKKSPLFWQSMKKGEKELKFNGEVSVSLMEAVLHYIYSGDVTPLQAFPVLSVSWAALTFELADLRSIIAPKLKSVPMELANISPLLVTATLMGDEDVLEAGTTYAAKHWGKLKDTVEFRSLRNLFPKTVARIDAKVNG